MEPIEVCVARMKEMGLEGNVIEGENQPRYVQVEFNFQGSCFVANIVPIEEVVLIDVIFPIDHLDLKDQQVLHIINNINNVQINGLLIHQQQNSTITSRVILKQRDNFNEKLKEEFDFALARARQVQKTLQQVENEVSHEIKMFLGPKFQELGLN